METTFHLRHQIQWINWNVLFGLLFFTAKRNLFQQQSLVFIRWIIHLGGIAIGGLSRK